MKKQSPRRLRHGERERGKRRPPFPIVGIGASAGGLEAFTQLLKALPLDTGLGFVLVQHLDPQHESALTQLLKRATSMPVHEVTDNQRVEPNHVYVIPRNRNLFITQGRLNLRPRQQQRSPQHSIDTFFESLAQDQRERAIGVILSGTATDGTVGLEAIKAEGGITFAQDESAKYDSMPRSATAAGCVDFVLAPDAIAKELVRIATHPYIAGQFPDSTVPEDDQASATAYEDDVTSLPSLGRGAPTMDVKRKGAGDEVAYVGAGASRFKKILQLLRNHSGVDFSLYKSSTIQRRIIRRMVLSKQASLERYVDFLRGNSKELDALYSDVLISVTSFFRNLDAFELLKKKVFPKLLQQRSDAPVRVWVLGCSTGQEAYSIAMMFMEALEQASRMRKLQVFATDLNEALLDKARHGLYAKSLSEDVSPERLRRFFVEEGGGYRVTKPLREMVVFARQNLISDPPFSRMDLVSCRNLLIYLEPSLQRKAIPTFHHALKPDGFLLLGASESIGGFTELFEAIDKKHKLYVKKAAPTPAFHLPMKSERDGAPLRESSAPRPTEKPQGMHQEMHEGLSRELNAQREADRVTVNQFAPPGVLINVEMQILQFRGPTGRYLQPPTGKASLDVLKMAREGLMLPLRAAINKAKKDNVPARKEQVRVQQNGTARMVNVEVIPLKNLRERCFLILFEDADKIGRLSPGARRAPRAVDSSVSTKQASSRIHTLERELAETRDYLQSVQEQHEAANEELQASNEEVQSANEELQSINEELETSKEELESSNEELTTVNEEMANRNQELSRLNADLTNLQASTKLPLLLIGHGLTIRRFSSPAERLFNLLAVDGGRPLSGIRHNLVVPKSQGPSTTPYPLEELVRDVIDNVRAQEREVLDKEGRWYTLRVHPYLTDDKKVDGAVLVLVDITDLKHTAEAAARLAAVVESSDDAIITEDLNCVIRTWNEGAARLFGYQAQEAVGRPVTMLILPSREDEEALILERIRRGETLNYYETIRRRKDGSMIDVSLTISPIKDVEGKIVGVAEIARDITERKRAADALAASHAELESHAEELTRFNRAAVGRELQMIELKKEINELCQRQGEPARYPLEFEQEEKDSDE